MTATSEISLLEQHPLSAAFPSMPEQEIEALAIDLEKHGQREPGVLFEGMVLDGWHRYIGCQKSGVEFRTVEFDGDDPVSYVLSKNLHRRHMNASQRAAAVLATSNWRPHGDQKSRSLPGRDRSSVEMAKTAEVSVGTIEQAKAGHRIGLGQEMKDGKVSAKAASEVAKLSPAKRAKAVKAIKEGKPPAPKKEKTPDADSDSAKARGELIDLQGKYADLLEKNAELADTAREMSDKLVMFETTEPDEQQQQLAKFQKRIVRLEAEVQRVSNERGACQMKCNELIRQVKRLQKDSGGH